MSNSSITNKTGSERKRFREIAKSYIFGSFTKNQSYQNEIAIQTCSNPSDKSNITNDVSESDLSYLTNSSSNDLSATEVNIVQTSTNSKDINANDVDSNTKISLTSSSSLLSNKIELDIDSDYVNERTVLIIRDVPAKIDIDSILQAVYCGPIEKIVKVLNPEDNNLIKYLELHFIKNQDAELFLKYSKSGNFLVNGQKLKCQWGTRFINEVSKKNFSKLEDLVYPENEQVYSQHGGSTIRTGARRCLILKKTNVEPKNDTNKKTIKNPYHLYSPNLAAFNINEVIKDFKVYGDIINISPVISRRLCISINYYDIRSAILAKEAFEKMNSIINKKYSNEWVVWYGKDVNDKPCISI
ncbi:uncharacterized protein HGUI_02950 [Hanseniaspora guilliermondii]|uniref:Uncharacterized protein n=1 Tax=Hanseniaspora guilliermondii TaxID=56406 RepID=A0A1L0FMG0_9ASCO|nr:uncharacterized protein HGUI_02950 [Hanseniaspora guilliermondii]